MRIFPAKKSLLMIFRLKEINEICRKTRGRKLDREKCSFVFFYFVLFKWNAEWNPFDPQPFAR